MPSRPAGQFADDDGDIRDPTDTAVINTPPARRQASETDRTATAECHDVPGFSTARTVARMELGNGWNLSEPICRKLRMLDYLADFRTASLVPPLPDWAQPGMKIHLDAIGDLEDFRARGWVDFTQDYSGGASIQLRGAGRAFIEDVRVRRADRAKRHQAARDALLHWLYDGYLAGRATPVLSEFVNTSFGKFYGVDFTEQEVNHASLWLRDKDLVKGGGAWGAGVLRPSITTEGILMVESGQSVNDQRPIPPTSVISITGSGNTVQNASPGATQHVSTTITDDHRQQALALAELIEQALPGLGGGAVNDAGALPSQIRTAVQAKDDNALRRAINAANVAMAGTVGTVLGGVLVQNIHDFMQAIGLA